MVKILIGIPTMGEIKARTALSIMETIRLNRDIECIPVFLHGNIISEKRERLVAIAQELLCSHIFFVDTDMKFDPDTLPRLLAHDKEIVGAHYNYRYLPLTSTVKFFGENGEPVITIPSMPEQIFEVAGIATGCLLIKMSVFSQIKRPWFPVQFDENGYMVLGEDIGFCEKAREQGLKIYCDPTIKVQHIGDYLY